MSEAVPHAAPDNDPLVAAIDGIIDQIGRGDLNAAMDGCKAALRLDPHCAAAVHLMGAIAFRMGNQGLAIELVERAHKLEPNFREHPAALAFISVTVGRLADALYYTKLATALAPHPHFANILPTGLPRGRMLFEHAGKSVHATLAHIAFSAGNMRDAAQEAELELRLEQRDYDMMLLAARARLALGDLDAALAHLRAAVHAEPARAAAFRWMSDALLARGEHDLALALQRKAAAMDAEDEGLPAHFLSGLAWQSDANRAAAAGFAVTLRERAEGGRRPRRIERPGTNYIGFLWDECREGPLLDFVLPVLQHLEGSILYRLNRRTDAATETVRAAVMRFQDCPDLDAATLDRIIDGDRPGALINLSGTPDEGRHPRLAGAGAPLCLQWLGLPMPDRLPGAAATIGSPETEDVDLASFGEENLIRLSRLFAWRFPATGGDEEIVRPLPRDLQQGRVTFGAHGDMRRITAETVALWAGVLHAVPNSTLRLGAERGWSDAIAKRLLDMFADFGVVHRIALDARTEEGRVNFELLSRIDILLDTAPVNGIGEVAQALWMGVPAVNLRGSRRGGRTGWAVLAAAGHPEWSASSTGEYARIAAGLAARSDLAELRAGLRAAIESSALCDAKGLAEELRAALLPRMPKPRD